MAHSAAVIQRTKGGKPYLAERPETLDNAPNWNFNVSHEGAFVVLAAEPVLLCGVDVAAPREARGGRKQTLEEHFATLTDYFTPREWSAIRACGPSEEKMEACFRQHWSLKEAFTKARGDGIAFEFKRIEFTLSGVLSDAVSGASLYDRATVAVDGTLLPAISVPPCGLYPSRHPRAAAAGGGANTLMAGAQAADRHRSGARHGLPPQPAASRHPPRPQVY